MAAGVCVQLGPYRAQPFEGDTETAAGRGFSNQVGAVQFSNSGDDGQAQTIAIACSLAGTEKPLTQAGQCRGGDSGAVIADAQVAAGVSLVQTDLDRAAGRGVAHRVVDQITQCDDEQVAITADRLRVWGNVCQETLGGVWVLLADGIQARIEQVLGADRAGFRRAMQGVEAGQA